MQKTTEELILGKMDAIIRILASLATRGIGRREQIAILNQAGLKPKEIAEILGISSNNVSVALLALRKSKSKKKAK